MNILVVDDSSLMRSMVRGTVEAHGRGRFGKVLEARDGAEALEVLQREEIGLLLLDWNMPRLDGITLVRQLRDEGREMPIVMVTSRYDRRHRMEAVRAGVTDYVAKPFQMAELWERIEAYL